MDLIEIWYDDTYYCTLHFETSLIDLDPDSWSQECKKAKTSVPIISQFSINLNGLWYTIQTCWCEEPHNHFILNIQCSRERSLFVIIWFCFLKKKFCLHSDICRPISFKLGVMIKITKLYMLISFWWPWPSVKSQLYKKSKTSVSIFSQIEVSI